MKEGDVLIINGKKVIVTYVDGKNFSYAPYVEPEKPEKKTRRVKK